MFSKPVKVTEIEVEGQIYPACYYEQKTARGSRRFSCEIVIDPTDRIILDDDSITSLESKVERLTPATIYSRLLAGRTSVAA